MSAPEVTIAIPTYNRVLLLRRALTSALAQSHRNFEVVICDDGSIDGTQAFLSRLSDKRVRIHAAPSNRGMFENMNACLSLARGKYFLMLSDDDYLEPDCVESLLEPWRLNGNLSMSYGQWWYYKPNGKELQVSAGPAFENGWDYVRGYWAGIRPTILHGVLFQTGDLVGIGGVPAGYAQDTMLTLRIAFEGKVAHVAKPVTHYCLQPDSNTHKLSLFRLIRDSEALLEMCLTTGRAKNIADEELRRLEQSVRRRLAADAAMGIVSMVGRGLSRASALGEAYRLRRYLRYRLTLGLAAMLSAAILPRATIDTLRRFRRLRAGLTVDDASIGIERRCNE